MKNKKSYCGNHIAMRDNVSNMKIYVVMGPPTLGWKPLMNMNDMAKRLMQSMAQNEVE